MSKFQDYCVQHLFLLVGENPLPNYVSARTLLESKSTAYLIYTSHTEAQAKRLRNRLDKLEISTQLISIDGYESDSYHIHQEVRRAVEKLPSSDSVGLNYTGGTKAMAVHAYRAMTQTRPDAIFSYLDSHRLELCIDQKDGDRFHQKVPICLTLEEIFDLHQLTLINPASTCPKLPEAASVLAQLHLDRVISTAWRTWCDRVKNSLKVKEESKLKKAPELDIETLLPELRTFLQKHFAATSNALSIQHAKTVEFDKHTHLWKWLDGEWLEEYTLQQIQTLTEKCKIFDSASNFHIKDPQINADKFQFDVAFTRSYQLFALSCTTDDSKGLCKQKLFEAYLRAKQLGGDEARVALVCCSDVPDYLKAQLEIMLENPKIAVFGRQHLANLAEHIEAWIIKNDREAQ
ncbi:Card1-like endonuclease domain-containing protein [Leptolyngbya sp. AN03gr2]|uniref:Card1-like endonuclease domain-containing protein n=1 Tax=unclassified Leptolyngbya TaxID=2650499 RepID=UPI003D3175CD